MSFVNNVKTVVYSDTGASDNSIEIKKSISPFQDPPPSGRLTLLNSLSNPTKIEIIIYTARTNATDSQTFAVTVANPGPGNRYYINGSLQQTITLKVGSTYIFNYPSNHPFRFSTTVDGIHGGGSEYSTGVTHNNATQTTIVVSDSTPGALYYYCAYHAGMGGNISVVSFWTLTGLTRGSESTTASTWQANDNAIQAFTAGNASEAAAAAVAMAIALGG